MMNAGLGKRSPCFSLSSYPLLSPCHARPCSLLFRMTCSALLPFVPKTPSWTPASALLSMLPLVVNAQQHAELEATPARVHDGRG